MIRSYINNNNNNKEDMRCDAMPYVANNDHITLVADACNPMAAALHRWWPRHDAFVRSATSFRCSCMKYLSYEKMGDETDYMQTARAVLELIWNRNVHVLPDGRMVCLILHHVCKEGANLRDPLFGYYSADIVPCNRAACSSTMLNLISNRMSNW